MLLQGAGAGGSLDPFQSLFASDWDKELKPLTLAASQNTTKAQAGLKLGPMLSDPIESIIGHHSGLLGPALADRYASVHWFCKAVRVLVVGES